MRTTYQSLRRFYTELPEIPDASLGSISGNAFAIQAESPPSLADFKNLPIEIREMIWKLVPEPRRVEIKFPTHFHDRWNSFAADVPSILHVCQESRVIGLKIYELSFINKYTVSPVYFNFAMDTLMPRTNATDQQLMAFAENISQKDQERVERIAVYKRNFDHYPRPPFVTYFPKLKQVMVLFARLEQYHGSQWMSEEIVGIKHECPPGSKYRTHLIDQDTMVSQIEDPDAMLAGECISEWEQNCAEGARVLAREWNFPEFTYQGFCDRGFYYDESRYVKTFHTGLPMKPVYNPGTKTGTVWDELAVEKMIRNMAEAKEAAKEKRAKNKAEAKELAQIERNRERIEARRLRREEEDDLREAARAAREEKRAGKRAGKKTENKFVEETVPIVEEQRKSQRLADRNAA